MQTMEWYGRKLAIDKRDYKMRRPTKTRQFMRWRSNQWYGNQGATPHCVGFAWTNWLTSSPISQFLDPEGIYEIAQYLDEWPGTDYDGTSVRAGAKVLHHLGLISRYTFTQVEATFRVNVVEKSPVVIGIDWHEGMEWPDDKGFIHAEGPVLGGHAILVVGYVKPGKYVLKQTWGQDWGKNGYAYLSPEDMAKLLKADGEACLAEEIKLRVPKKK